MDPTSAIRTDTLPAIGTVFAPGALAVSPYLALAIAANPRMVTFFHNHEATAVLAFVVACVAVGLFIESTGSYVEYYVLDRLHANREEMIENWWAYLGLAWEREPVGQRYLRRLLVVFKFELNTFVALVLTVPGLAWAVHTGLHPPNLFKVLVTASVLLGLYFLFASYQSSVLLAKIRSELLKRSDLPAPPNESGCSRRRLVRS